MKEQLTVNLRLLVLCLLLPVFACDAKLPGQPKLPEGEALMSIVRDGTGHTDAFVRAETARLIRHKPKHKSALTALLEDDSALVRLAAIDSLFELGDYNTAQEALRSVLEDSTGAEQQVAIRLASRHLEETDRSSFLRVALKSPQANVRQEAIEALVAHLDQGFGDNSLNTVDGRELQKLVSTFTQDPDVTVATRAHLYIAAQRPFEEEAKEKRDRLRTLARSGEPDARARAIWLLALLGDEEVRFIADEALVASSTLQGSEALRRESLIALGMMGIQTQFKPLVELFHTTRSTEHLDRKLRILDAIARSNHADTPFVLNEALLDTTPAVQLRALKHLERRKGTIKRFDELFDTPNPKVIQATFALLAKQSRDKLQQTTTQKLAVAGERRNHILEGLSLWLDQSPNNTTPEWLVAIQEPVRDVVESGDPDVSFHAYALLVALDGSAPLLDPNTFKGLPPGGQMRALESALETGSRPSDEVLKVALESPYFLIRLCAALLAS